MNGLVYTLYRPEYQYKRAGVFLSQIRPQQVRQADLFGVYNHEVASQQERLMAVIDKINRLFGRDTIFYGSQGIQRSWFMQQRRLSSRATTRWSEILTVS